MEGEDAVGTVHTRLSIGLRKIAYYVLNQRLCMNGNKLKSGSTFKILRNIGEMVTGVFWSQECQTRYAQNEVIIHIDTHLDLIWH